MNVSRSINFTKRYGANYLNVNNLSPSGELPTVSNSLLTKDCLSNEFRARLKKFDDKGLLRASESYGMALDYINRSIRKLKCEGYQ